MYTSVCVCVCVCMYVYISISPLLNDEKSIYLTQ